MKSDEVAYILLKEQICLTAYINAILRDFQRSEDVFQDVVVKAIGNASCFNDRLHLIRWTRVTARNRSIDLLRKKNRHKQILMDEQLLELLHREWPEEEPETSGVILKQLAGCIEKMTPNNQEIVRLRYFKALSGIEVARRLNRKVRTVYQALSRIHKQLRECMQGQMNVHRVEHS